MCERTLLLHKLAFGSAKKALTSSISSQMPLCHKLKKYFTMLSFLHYILHCVITRQQDMAESYLATALKGTSMHGVALSDLLAGASSSEPLDWMVGPPSESDCSGANQLGGRLKPFHWVEGGLPAHWETAVAFRGS